MEGSYNQLAEDLKDSQVEVAKFQADTDREFAQQRLQLQTFPTIIMLPKSGTGKQVRPMIRQVVSFTIICLLYHFSGVC